MNLIHQRVLVNLNQAFRRITIFQLSKPFMGAKHFVFCVDKYLVINTFYVIDQG